MSQETAERGLEGKVALVAGATRGAGRAIAVELARAGAYVYATGRSSRVTGPSEIGRPETIEETGELMHRTGGAGEALRVDHLEPDQVADLVARIEDERGRLDVLVNDIFGGDRYAQWDKKLWEHDLDGGLRMLRMGIDTHLVTAAKALPLMLRGDGGLVVEMTDGTADFNASFREGVGFYYDLVKAAVGRITIGLTAELAGTSCTALAVTPGWLRSENMLEKFGVTEETLAGRRPRQAALLHLRVSDVRRTRDRRAGGGPGCRALCRQGALERGARADVRRHRHGRDSPRLLALPGGDPASRQTGDRAGLSLRRVAPANRAALGRVRAHRTAVTAVASLAAGRMCRLGSANGM